MKKAVKILQARRTAILAAVAERPGTTMTERITILMGGGDHLGTWVAPCFACENQRGHNDADSH
jgi:hypothetical protein